MPGLKTGATVLLIISTIAMAAFLLISSPSGPPKAYAALDLGRLTPDLVAKASNWLLPAMLGQIYSAFEATEEAAIYDELAVVADGEALEALYLERVGAMAGGGIEAADQTIHEFQLLDVASRPATDRVEMDATWRVVGTVGHAEHMHMRGNSYSASLVLTPVGEAWKITGFTLTDVDRSEAGEMVPAKE